MTNKRAAQVVQAVKFLLDNGQYTEEVEEALDLAIKALEERPTGEWIFDGFCFSSSKFKCSICHYPELEKTNYCPTCGAKMEGGRE